MSSFRPIPIAKPLLAWYAQHARPLPWRETSDPYAIWVSEIMLQQTRVEAVKPYYARFLAALPTISALAACDEERLLKLWEGLGYYSRVRNMQKAAQMLLDAYDGQFPRTASELQKLPGIGPYTAGAIASIAFGQATPAVDGNVLRVLARLADCHADIALPKTKADAAIVLLEMIPPHAPGAFNQALMELGACVCLPNAAPLCESCPLHDSCLGQRNGTAMQLPVKSKTAPRRIEQHTVFVLRREGKIAVRKRQPSGLLAGLWELPNLPSRLSQQEMAAQLSAWGVQPTGAIARYTAKHIFTHVEWHMRVYALQAGGAPLPPGWAWSGEGDIHALPSAFKACLQMEKPLK